jgi:hypothetical protein
VPCIQLESPCELVDNKFKEIQTHFFTSDKTITVSDAGGWNFKAYTNSLVYLSISFSSKPDISKMYSNSGVNVIYYQNGGQQLYGSGDVYVNYENGVYTISGCNCDFSFYGNTFNFDDYDQYFKVTFN